MLKLCVFVEITVPKIYNYDNDAVERDDLHPVIEKETGKMIEIEYVAVF